MKHKYPIHSRLALASSFALCISSASADCWYNQSSSGGWTANFKGNAAGTGSSVTPGSTDDCYFDTTPKNGTATSCYLSGSSSSAKGFIFNNSSTTTVYGTGSSTRTLNLGTDGVKINSGAGAVTLGTSGNDLLRIALAADQTWTNSTGNTCNIYANITGSYTITTAGTGTFAFNDLLTESFSGLTVGTGSTVNITSNNWLPNSCALTVNGTMNMGGNGEICGTLNGSGTINETGSQILYANSGTFSGQYNGSNGAVFQKQGTGTLTFSGANGYSGGTTISGGTLLMSGSGTLGSTSGALSVSGSGATLDLGNTNQTVGAATFGGSATIQSTGGTKTLTTSGVTVSGTGNTIAGSAIVAGNTSLGSGAALANNGAITGTLAIGNGTLTGSGSVSGAATLNGGTINLGSGGSLSSTLGVTGGNWNGAGSVTGLVTSSSGTLTIGSGANLTANGGLSVTGGTLAGADSTATITGSLNYTSSSSSSFGGVIAGNSNTLTLNNSSATLTLSGTSTYSGNTTVSSGTLLVNGSISTSTTYVSPGGTLGGSGNVGPVTVNGGTIIGGNATTISILTSNGGISLATGAGPTSATLAVNLSTVSASASEIVTGAGGLTIAPNTILSLNNLVANSVMAPGTRLTLVDYSAGSLSGIGNLDILATTSGSTVTYDPNGGTPTALANGEQFNAFGNTFSINYDDTSGGGNYLSLTTVPEPQTALLGGMGVLLLLRRRRA